jgi:hypothetical protein
MSSLLILNPLKMIQLFAQNAVSLLFWMKQYRPAVEKMVVIAIRKSNYGACNEEQSGF